MRLYAFHAEQRQALKLYSEAAELAYAAAARPDSQKLMEASGLVRHANTWRSTAREPLESVLRDAGLDLE
jgi:hypothetical protein